jgi:hypothetical protein
MSPQKTIVFVLILVAASTLLLDACTTTSLHTHNIIRRLNDGFTDDNFNHLRADTDLFALYESEQNNTKQALKEKGENASKHLNAIYFGEAKKRNDQAFAAFSLKASNRDYAEAANKALRRAHDDQTAKVSRVYDFEDGDQIGFCFARALLIHYLLLQNQVSQRDIFKIFAIGELKLEHQIWRFHVAVLLKTKQGPLVIDPLFEDPVPLAQWRLAIERLDIKTPFPRVRFYITDPRKFLPATGVYALENVMDPHLRDYFVALFENLS